MLIEVTLRSWPKAAAGTSCKALSFFAKRPTKSPEADLVDVWQQGMNMMNDALCTLCNECIALTVLRFQIIQISAWGDGCRTQTRLAGRLDNDREAVRFLRKLRVS